MLVQTGVGCRRAHARERRRSRRTGARAAMYILGVATVRTVHSTRSSHGDRRTRAPTLRALLGRRDLHLRLEGDEAFLGEGALDRPLRWVHSSDLADPTPFLSEGLALLTTGTQFQDAGDDAFALPRLRAPAGGPRRGRSRLRHRGGARRHPAAARRRVPCRADAAVRGALPHAVHRRGPRRMPRRSPRSPTRDAAGRSPRSVRSRSRRCARTGSGRRSPSSPASSTRGSGCSTRRALSRASIHRRLEPAVAARAAGRGRRRCCGEAPARHPRSASAACRSRCRPSAAAATFAGVIAMAAGDLDQEGRGVVTAVVAMAGLALEQHQGLDRARTLLRAGLVQSLRSGDPALARRIARDLWGGLPAAPVLVAMTDAGAARARGGRASGSSCAPTSARGGLFFGRGDDGLVLVVHAGRGRGARRVRGRGSTRGSESRIPRRTTRSPSAPDQARLARDRGVGARHATSPTSRAPACSRSRRRMRRARSPPPRSRRCARHDAEHGTALVETVRAWLENDCSHEATARALGVHRHTVRARIAARRARARRRPLVVRGSRRALGGAAPLVLIRPERARGGIRSSVTTRRRDPQNVTGEQPATPARPCPPRAPASRRTHTVAASPCLRRRASAWARA